MARLAAVLLSVLAGAPTGLAATRVWCAACPASECCEVDGPGHAPAVRASDCCEWRSARPERVPAHEAGAAGSTANAPLVATVPVTLAAVRPASAPTRGPRATGPPGASVRIRNASLLL